MKSDGTIWIDTKIDTSDFKTLYGEIGNLDNKVSGLTQSFKRVGSAIKSAFSVATIIYFTKQIVNVSKELTKLGSDLMEVQNVVDVTFGGLNTAINRFANNALESFGLSELSAKKFTSTLGAMLKSMGFATDQAAAMSIELAGLAGDMASFYNLEPEEAFNKIRAGISGETEPLKQLGINLSVANLEAFALAQGIGKAYSAMTQQEQTLLRYNYLLAVTADAQGDFARTSGSWANQTRILSERFKALKATIGQGLINAFLPVIKLINKLLEGLQVLANAFRDFTAMLFGDASKSSGGGSSSGISSIGDAMDNVSESIGSAASGAQKLDTSTGNIAKNTERAEEAAKRYLASFDEINKLGEPEIFEEDSGIDDIGDINFDIPDFGSLDLENLDLGEMTVDMDIKDELSPKFEKIVNKIKELLEPLKKIDFSNLKESLSKLGESFKNLGSVIGNALEWAWYNILVPFAEWTIEEAAPALINLLAEAFDFLAIILKGLGPLAVKLWENFLQPLASWAGDRVVDLINGLADALDRIGTWISNNHEPVNNFFILLTSIAGSLGTFAGISKLIEYIKAVIAMAPEVGLLTAMFPKLSTAIASVGTFLSTKLIPAITGAFSAIAAALGVSVGWVIAIAAAIGAAIAAVIIYWDEIKAFFTTTFPELLEKAKQFISEKITQIGEFFVGLRQKISEIFQQIYEYIVQFVLNAAAYILTNFINPIKNWWDELRQSIAQTIAAVFENVSSTFEQLRTFVVSRFIDPIKSAFQSVSDWITEKFTAAKENVQAVWESLATWFNQNIVTPITDFFEKLKLIAAEIREIMSAFTEMLNITPGKVTFEGLSAVMDTFRIKVEEIATFIQEVIEEKIINPIKSKFEALKESLSKISEGIKDFIKGDAREAAQGVEQEFVQPTEEEIQGVSESIQNSMNDAKNGIVLSMESAARGTQLSFIEPLEQSSSELAHTMIMDSQVTSDRVVDNWVNAARDTEVGFINPTRDNFSNLSHSITNDFDTARQSIQSDWRGMPSWFQQNVTSPMTGFFNDLVSALVSGFNKTAQQVASAIRDLMSMLNQVLSHANSVTSRVSRTTYNAAYNAGQQAAAPALAYPTMDIPMLARGAVIPPNHKFLAVLGDQKSGTNVEAPLATIQEAVALVMEDMIQSNIAGHEATVEVLRQILEAVLGIELDGETLSRAINRHNRKMAMVRGI